MFGIGGCEEVRSSIFWAQRCGIGLDCAVFYVPPTQYRYGFYRSKDPTNSIKVLRVHIVHRDAESASTKCRGTESK